MLGTELDKSAVLLLRSTFIDVSSLNVSPRYPQYVFHIFETLKYLEGDFSLTDTLAEIISFIEQIDAKFIIVHLGVCFQKYPIQLMHLVRALKDYEPSLRIGLDMGKGYALTLLRGLSGRENGMGEIIELIESGYLVDESSETMYLCCAM